MSRFVLISVFALTGAVAGAQSAEKALAFDAPSIKPAAETAVGGRGAIGNGNFRFLPGKLTGSAVTVRGMVLEAYRLTHYQLSGGPAWMNSERFDLEAKSETAADEAQLRLMLRTLLDERFGLVAHRGSAEMPVYALTVGKAGLNVAQGTVQRLTDRLNTLPEYIRRPVLDKTGITEVYQFSIGITSWDNVPSDVEEQCGLRLEPRRAVMDTLVVDRIDRPSAN